MVSESNISLREQMPDPLKIEDCSSALQWMIEDQPQREWLIQGYIPTNCVGFLQADGGVGKSNLANLIALVIATGKQQGPFIPESPKKVLIINVEDSKADIALRMNVLGNLYSIKTLEYSMIKQNLLIYPGSMTIGPLMALENNKPIPTEYMEWLDESIKNLKPALTILDTKSRLFGLEENSNTHNSIWIQQLNKISHKHGCGFLIIHHNKKPARDDKNSLSADQGRGGSSQGHDARYVISGASISLQEAKRFNLWPVEDYFKIATSKMNYSKRTSIEYFRKMDEGIPVHVVPVNNKAIKICDDLIEWLKSLEGSNIAMTKRSLLRFDTAETKLFKKTIEDKYYGKAPKGINADIELALKLLFDDGKITFGEGSKRGNAITLRYDEDF